MRIETVERNVLLQLEWRKLLSGLQILAELHCSGITYRSGNHVVHHNARAKDAVDVLDERQLTRQVKDAELLKQHPEHSLRYLSRRVVSLGVCAFIARARIAHRGR